MTLTIINLEAMTENIENFTAVLLFLRLIVDKCSFGDVPILSSRRKLN